MNINIPNDLTEKHLNAFKNIAEKLLKNPEIDTLFFSGSFYNGDPGPNSDLDFIAITKPEFDYSQRIQDVSDGIFYELFVYSENQLEKSFERMDYQDMHMVGYGFLVFSKTQNFEGIKNLAKGLFEKGPAKISDEQLEYEKYLLWDKYTDILDVRIKNPNLARSLMNILLWDALRLLYINKRVWFPKRKRLFESLTKIDKDIYELVFEFLNSPNDEEYLLEKLGKIVENIIYPNKLSDPFIWQSEKKVL
jgi:hypothetical protein